MNLERLTMAATVHRRSVSGTDEYGNPAHVEADVGIVCHARQASATERTQNVDVEEWILYVAPDVEIDADDSLTIAAGITFEIVGPPAERLNPRTGLVEGKTARMVVTS